MAAPKGNQYAKGADNGRPTDYTPELATRICDLIADGNSVRKICERDDMPSRSSVILWLTKYEDFSIQYAYAKQQHADNLFDDVLEIADQYDPKADQADVEHIQRARLRIDARKWMAGKLRPKKYGDKIQQEVSGPSGGPIAITDARMKVGKLLGLTEEQIREQAGDTGEKT